MNGIENGVKISGVVQIHVRRANNPDVNELVFEDHNAIVDKLKENFRDTMNSSVDFAMDNLQSTPVPPNSLTADGAILIFNTQTPTTFPGDLVAVMGTAVHPSDPSGNFYRQWQGTYTEVDASNTVKSARIGEGVTGASIELTNEYAFITFPDIVLVLNDILTANWKISIG